MHDAFSEPINAMRYGLLNSAVSWVNLVAPFFVGPFIDRRATRIVAIWSLLVALFGQLLFASGVHTHIFGLALVGRFVFGMGEGAVMIAQAAACAQWFRGGELTFAIAITEMFHNMSNWSGKVIVSTGDELGGWWITLWIGVLMCILGLLAGCMFGIIERRHEQSHMSALNKQVSAPVWSSYKRLTVSFWILLVIHLLVSNTEHLFDTVSASFIQNKWHDHTSKAAWLSSLNYSFAIVLSPLTSLLIDKSNWRMIVAMLACVIMGSAHLLLGLTRLTPAVGLSALSFPQAVMPTIIKSSVPLVVSPSIVGLAFGALCVAENFGKTFGAPLIGYVKDQDGNYLYDEFGFASASFLAAGLVALLSFRDRASGGVLDATPRRRRSECLCLIVEPETVSFDQSPGPVL